MKLKKELSKIVKDVHDEEDVLDTYSRDTSIFEVKPEIVVFPENSEEIKKLVKFVSHAKIEDKHLSITSRSAGTDMSGGALGESIILGFTKHMNKLKELKENSAVVEPGLFYRDFEKETSEKNLLLPSFPASKSICALGGMVANNSGGELSPSYGKTQNYVESLNVVLADGNEYSFKKLTMAELKKKIRQKDFEGKIYRELFDLINKNYDLIQKEKPEVTKNSAGYYLWDVYDKKAFDLTQLFTGSQGTLGIITEIKLRLIKKKQHSRLIVCFIDDMNFLNDFVNIVLPHKPKSLETFDDNTLKLALKFLPGIAKKTGTNLFSLLWSFRREGIRTLIKGLPKFTVLVELENDSLDKLNEEILKLSQEFKNKKIDHLVMKNEKEGKKYWTVRRESFNLLREKVKDKHATAFIDDFAVLPKHLPEFWPQLEKILKENEVPATIAGHAGSGNFHIIPLMDLSKKEERDKIQIVSEKVYSLVAKYKGTITAEHNDGLIRTPYLDKMFSPKMIKLFEEVKKILDPLDIFNPGKKVHGDINYSMSKVKMHL